MEETKLRTQLAGMSLEHPILIGPGVCKNLADIRHYSQNAAAGIVLGTITHDERAGNTGNTFVDRGQRGAVNSLGMPNDGREYLRENIGEMVQVMHAAGKVLGVSVAGDSPEEFADTAFIAFDGGADFVKINAGCPNKWDGGVQGRILSFDLKGMELVVQAVCDLILGKFPEAVIGVKRSPYSDPVLLRESTEMLAGYPIKLIVASNTFPNGRPVAIDGAPLITKDARGYGGVSGEAMKDIALGQVRMTRECLDELGSKIEVIGAGGITEGRDVLEFLGCGAAAVEVVTAVYRTGERSDGLYPIMASFIENVA